MFLLTIARAQRGYNQFIYVITLTQFLWDVREYNQYFAGLSLIKKELKIQAADTVSYRARCCNLDDVEQNNVRKSWPR